MGRLGKGVGNIEHIFQHIPHLTVSTETILMSPVTGGFL